MDLVSIVIPVYNTGEPMRACLDSVLAQTYTNLEILLVDDHSTDQLTLDLLHEYVRKDSRFTLLTSPENNGLPATRNIGINHANGKYITFLDSDDQFVPDFIERMYRAVSENQTDFSVCHIKQFVLDESLPLEPDFVFPMTESNKVETSLFLKEKMLMNMPISACGKLINLQKLKQKNLYFLEEMRYAEDQDWICRLFCTLNSFSVVDFYGINRLLRANSMIHAAKERDLLLAIHAQYLKAEVLKQYGWFDAYRLEFFDQCLGVLGRCFYLAESNEVKDRLLQFAVDEYEKVGFSISNNPNYKKLFVYKLKYKLSKLLGLSREKVVNKALYKAYSRFLQRK